MAEARRQEEWVRVGVAVAWVVNSNGFRKGRPLTPLQAIPRPFRPKPPPPRPPRVAGAEESRQGWFVLDSWLGRMADGGQHR
jgi:hypothetical protein